MSENFFWGALLLSLTIHTSVLWGTYFWKTNNPHDKAMLPNHVEISYKPLHHRAVDIREYPIRPAQQLDLGNNSRIFSTDGTIPISLVKEKQMLPLGMLYERKSERHTTM